MLLDPQFAESLPLLFDFLGVPDPECAGPRTDPELRQRLLFAAMKRLVHARSRREAALSVLEDLHWIDRGSEAFLENFVEAVAGTRTLVVVNFRPEYHAGWMQKSYYQQLPLAALGPEASAELLGDLLGADPALVGAAARPQRKSRHGARGAPQLSAPTCARRQMGRRRARTGPRPAPAGPFEAIESTPLWRHFQGNRLLNRSDLHLVEMPQALVPQ